MRFWMVFVVVTAYLLPALHCYSVDFKENHPHVHRRANVEPDTTPTLNRKHIRITTIEEKPFLMLKRDGEGNDRFEGYILDVLRLIAKKLSFDYTLELVADGRYGSRDEHGNWNGMIGELISGDADMAAAALIMTSVREQVVDFSTFSMASGISVVQKKPAIVKESNLFAIFAPFTVSVWVCLLVAVFIVGLVIYFLNRVSPYEWRAVAKRGKVSARKGQHFNVMNSMWFAFSTLTLQGYPKSPRSISVRLLSCFWFLFVIVILFAYLSNLSPFLTREKITPSVGSIDELSMQTDISYGTIRDGSTSRFFKKSNVDIYKRMWNAMASNASVFVESLEEGVERVRNSEGKYAFIGDSPSLEHIAANQPCDLSVVPGEINQRWYGFAFPQNSTLRDDVSLAIIMLTESGDLDILRQKWWTGSCNVGSYNSRLAAEGGLRPRAVAISLENISGVFIILLIGMALSVLLALCERMLYSSNEEKKKEKKADV